MSDTTRLYGVLVTYKRPGELAKSLDKLLAQTRRLDRLVVMDNGSTPESAVEVERYKSMGADAVYIDAGDNIGPAEGYARGLLFHMETAGPDDWVFTFDDDDPPYFDDAIENAANFAQKMVAEDPLTAGVGISGGRFDFKKAVLRRIGDAEIDGAVPVDFIAEGGLPCYRLEVMREVGVHRGDLFFSYEEIELGLRIWDSGYRLYADGEQWKHRKATKRALGELPAESVLEARAKTDFRIKPAGWRRYYSLRNLIWLLRKYGRTRTALTVTLTRGILKPLVNLPLAPRDAWENLKVNSKAIVHGWRDELGWQMRP
jgi:rhamnopyranosyl-N-acetylglucosaminyl-diphospho-decaprenol beta-1,3/1,4-galactofuranosyltransferase